MGGNIAIDTAEKGHEEMLSSNIGLTLCYPIVNSSTVFFFSFFSLFNFFSPADGFIGVTYL